MISELSVKIPKPKMQKRMKGLNQKKTIFFSIPPHTMKIPLSWSSRNVGLRSDENKFEKRGGPHYLLFAYDLYYSDMLILSNPRRISTSG